MSTKTIPAVNTTFKIGWIGLLVITALATANHIILPIVLMDEAVLFIGWAAYNLYALLVLAIPFRRGERWAWYTSWLLVIGFASLIFFDTEIGPYYIGAAVLMAVGLLLTYKRFFAGEATP